MSSIACHDSSYLHNRVVLNMPSVMSGGKASVSQIKSLQVLPLHESPLKHYGQQKSKS